MEWMAYLNTQVFGDVAGGQTVQIRELAQMICQNMGVSPRFVYSGGVRAGEVQQWTADISKLKSLGYELRLALADGLKDTTDWFLREMDLLAIS